MNENLKNFSIAGILPETEALSGGRFVWSNLNLSLTGEMPVRHTWFAVEKVSFPVGRFFSVTVMPTAESRYTLNEAVLPRCSGMYVSVASCFKSVSIRPVRRPDFSVLPHKPRSVQHRLAFSGGLRL